LNLPDALNFGLGTSRHLAFDPTDWNELWIVIVRDQANEGTHQATFFMNGSTEGTTLTLTAGNGDDYPGQSYLAIGGTRTAQSFALDIDFVAYRPGIYYPSDPGQAELRFTEIRRDGGALVLEWSGGGTLQATAAVGQPWEDLAGAVSPARVTLSQTQRLYRLRR
jgi:hypothetical protein